MSLKDKFEKIKQTATTQKNVEKIEDGKNIVSKIGNDKQALENRINDLSQLLSQLEETYSSSPRKLDEFKGAKLKINELFTQYADYLKEQGINSVSDILSNQNMAKEEEVVDYQEKGVAQIGNQGKRGALGEQVEKLSVTKEKIKAELPDENLDFRGGTKEGKNSPRTESILKIKAHIEKLQEELNKTKEKEAETKQEYLPVIKEALQKKIDELLPENRSNSIGAGAANLKFIDNGVFRLAGDQYWNEVKEIAQGIIADKFRERGIKSISQKEINDSLEAEKLIFDVEEIRSKYEELLKKERDQYCLSTIAGDIKSEIREDVIIKDKKAYPYNLLNQAEDVNKKNPEAKRVCEEFKENILIALTEAEAKIKPGIFTGKENKAAMDRIKEEINSSKDQLNRLSAPENYYKSEGRWDFYNTASSSKPYFNYNYSYDWYKEMVKELEPKYTAELKKLDELNNNETEKLRLKTSDDIYKYGHASEWTTIGEIKIPVLPLEKNYAYQHIHDKSRIDAVLARLSDQALSPAQLQEQFAAEEKTMADEIKKYPQSEEILARFKKLVKEYDEKFASLSDLIDIKRQPSNYRGFGTVQKESYRVKQELFYE